jgi:hypothetical protein
VVALAVFAGACGGTLDAGRNNPPAPPDACATDDAALRACTPTGLLDNLVGYWRLDDGAGSTVAFDSSGRGNNGTLHGLDTNTAWVTGRSLGALETGHAGWVQVAHSPSIDSISHQVTVAAWVDLESPVTAPDNFGTALSRQIGTGQNQYYHLSIFQGQANLFITTDAGYVSPHSQALIPQGTWTHLAGVFDGTTARVYVNGVEVDRAPLTGTFRADTTPVILSGNGNDASGVPNELFPGRIDELMLYARALSAEEISQLAAGALFPGGARDAGAD